MRNLKSSHAHAHNANTFIINHIFITKSILKMKAIKAKPQKLEVLNISIEKPFSANDVFEELKSEVLNGYTDIKKAYLFLHQMSKILEMFKKDNHLKAAFEKKVKELKGASFCGFALEWIEKKTYDFSDCNDPVLTTINEEFAAMKFEKEKREEYLKFYNGTDFNRPTIKRTEYAEVRKAA